MPQDSLTLINLIITVLLALVAFFGGMVIRGLSEAVRELRDADKDLVRELGERVRTDDFREFRAEMRTSFDGVFRRLDELRDSVGDKVSRTECATIRSKGQ